MAESAAYHQIVGGVLFAIRSQGTNGEVVRGALVLKGVMPGIESNDPVQVAWSQIIDQDGVLFCDDK